MPVDSGIWHLPTIFAANNEGDVSPGEQKNLKTSPKIYVTELSRGL